MVELNIEVWIVLFRGVQDGVQGVLLNAGDELTTEGLAVDRIRGYGDTERVWK